MRSESMYSKVLAIAILTFLTSCSEYENEKGNQNRTDYKSWEVRGGSSSSIRYSELDQINAENVNQLEVEWVYNTGDTSADGNTEMQANPIIVDGTLYSTSPRLKVIALDAASGEEQWVFDPFADTTNTVHQHRNRAVAYWEDGDDKRILYTAGPWLYAINALDGTLVEEFGQGGRASFRQGLGDRKDGTIFSTSPGVIYEDLFISGSTALRGTPGSIRAFSVRTGELVWVFHTIPHPEEYGYDTWEDPLAYKRVGHANAWAGLSLDKQRGIVYAPTGSASNDFYGGHRKGSNLFANTLLALDASTGERVWHFQTIHHDLWDYDLPSQPALLTVTHNEKQIDAVAQVTKTGFVFLFNRETGDPLFPIEEKTVPIETELKGEQAWPTQPYPTRPEPFMRQDMTENDINPYIFEEAQDQLSRQLKSLKSSHIFEPPSLEGTLIFPGFDGGAEWGGSAFDPETGILYVNNNEVPWTATMVPEAELNDEISSPGNANTIARGRELYRANCVSCHSIDRKGGGNNPSLLDIEQRYPAEGLFSLINSGRGMMPSFSHLSDANKQAIVNYLIDEEHFTIEETESSAVDIHAQQVRSPYRFTGHKKFQTPEGYPANSPPWGALNAIDLNTGEYVWRIPLGEYPELKEKGIPPTGTENYGGPVVTAGGLVFIAATLDEKIRAFDKATGELLWQYDLPAAGYATPSVYEIKGRQYVVIAAGGGKLGTPSGDAYV
ncbi:MAG: PQQ-binding-like beta-propeller repeat protein, partial [Balneolales bacterium]